MDFTLNLGWIDLATIIVFLISMVTLGCWVGWKQRKNAEGSDFFLASRSLLWPVIGLSLFSTNISAIELVSLAEEGYKRGLVYGNLEWMGGLSLIVLAVFFVPFFIRSRVTTLPDFLFKRYNNSCRVFQVIIAIFTAIFLHTGFALFAGAKVMQGLFNMPLIISATIILGLTGLYCIIGGLKAVVLTDAVATIVLIAGSIVLTVICFQHIGGWDGLLESVEPVKFHMLRSSEDVQDMSWYSVLLGFPIIGIWYFCTDQTIAQRVLGSKDENHARTGVIFTGFIKFLPVFIFLMPGLILFGLFSKGQSMFPAFPLNPDGSEDTAQAYSYLIANMLPVGLKGIVAAALLAALMSTISSALNSIATVFCYDIYKPIRPQANDKELIKVGRTTTVVAMVLAILWAPWINRFESILEGNTMIICYIAPAITAIYLAGVLWEGASAKGAFITLIAGTLMGGVIFILDFAMGKWHYSFMMTSFWMFIGCVIILVLASRAFPQVLTEESKKLVWKNPLEALREPSWKGFGNYKFLSILLLAVMVLLYVLFQMI